MRIVGSAAADVEVVVVELAAAGAIAGVTDGVVAAAAVTVAVAVAGDAAGGVDDAVVAVAVVLVAVVVAVAPCFPCATSLW